MTKPRVVAWAACALLAAHGIAHAQQPSGSADASYPSTTIPGPW